MFVFLGKEGAACGGGAYVPNAVTAQQLSGAKTGAVQAGIHFFLSLGKVKLDAQPLLRGIAHQTFPQLVVAGVLGVDAGIDANPAIIVAVPFFRNPAQLLTLLVGVEVEILVCVDKPVGGKGHICLDARFCGSFCHGVGIVIKVADGGDAEAQTLRNTQQSRRLGAAPVQLILPLQLLLQHFPLG